MRPVLSFRPALTITTFLLLAAAGATAQTTDVILPTVSGEVGDRVSTALELQNAPGITGITIDIAFNSALVTPDPNITMGPLGDSIANINGANVVGDTLKLAVATFGDTVGYVGSGTLLTIEWDLVASGLAPLQFMRVLLEDNHSPPALPAHPVNGLITIQGGPPPSGCECPAGQPRVTVSDNTGRDGDQIQFDIGVQELPVPLDAFGLTLEYDSSMLSFTGAFECVDLAANWAFCNAVENTPGEITVGGFHTAAIPVGETGSLVRLTFDVDCPTCTDGDSSELHPTNLEDDLAEVPTCCGLFTYGEACSSDGDVNQNGSLSPGDSQCAFKMFFNNQQVTDDCDVEGDCEVTAADVNCDATVTPGDALAIFSRYLAAGDPEHCFNEGMPGKSAPSGVAQPVAAFRLQQSVLTTAPVGPVAVPIVARATAGGAAFGLELVFDRTALELVGIEPTASAAGWQGMDAVETSPGHVIAGAFDPHGLSEAAVDEARRRDGTVTIGHLVLRKKTADAQFDAVEWTERLIGAAVGAGEHGSAAPPAGFLGRPFPNPMRAGIAVDLTVPDGGARELRVAVYDVSGRRVRTLHEGTVEGGIYQLEWDGRDHAGHTVVPGIYFMKLAAGERVESRKIVVLD